MAATVTISAISQLLSASGSGVKGDVDVGYSFANPDGNYNVHLEFESSSGNWVTAWDCVGTFGGDITSTTTVNHVYFQSPDQYGNVENTDVVNFRIKAFKS